MPESPGRSRRERVVNGLVIGLIALGVIVVALALAGRIGGDTTIGGDRIGYVEITGVIQDARPVIRQLRHFTEKNRVPVVLLRIDSPGGAVGASQEIYRQVQITRERGVKVIVSMGNLAASGGYYIACAADTIVANPGTITGSIGVIAEFTQVDTLLDKIGVNFIVLKSGKFKDTGSPFRPMRRDERDVLQGVIADEYDQFVEAVAKARGIDRARLDSLAQGQIFTGRQAYALGLIDTLGNYDDAIRIARDAAGLGEDAELIRAPSPSRGILQRLIDGAAEIRHAPTVSVSYRMF